MFQGCKSKVGGKKKNLSLGFWGPFRERTGSSPSGPLLSVSPGPTCVSKGMNSGAAVAAAAFREVVASGRRGASVPGHRHGGRPLARFPGGSGWAEGKDKLCRRRESWRLRRVVRGLGVCPAVGVLHARSVRFVALSDFRSPEGNLAPVHLH